MITSRFTDVRLDPGFDVGTSLEVDYVRIGTVSPDGDGDGLPDAAETGTGVFVSPEDVGSNPFDPDTDGDGFDDGVEVASGSDPNLASSTHGPGTEVPAFGRLAQGLMVAMLLAAGVIAASGSRPQSLKL